MAGSFFSGLILLAGFALLATAFALHMILLEAMVWMMVLAGAGTLLAVWGAVALRTELGAMVRQRRGEIVLYTLGVIGVLIALAYVSVRYPWRFDLTRAGLYSLSEQTVTMLKRLEKPVHIVFFHDPLMREAVELYELIAAQTPLVTVERTETPRSSALGCSQRRPKQAQRNGRASPRGIAVPPKVSGCTARSPRVACVLPMG